MHLREASAPLGPLVAFNVSVILSANMQYEASSHLVLLEGQ